MDEKSSRTPTESLWRKALACTFHGEEDLKAFTGRLYHYTTSDGLLGILQSQKVWGTEAAYLNDANEIEYGRAFAGAALEQGLASGGNEAAMRVIRVAQERLSKRKEELYVACFSESGDLLSQWKGYARFGDGYSIELDPSELSRFKRKSPFVNISIQRVVYDRQRQQELLQSDIQGFLDECARLIAADSTFAERIERAAGSSLAHVLQHRTLFFKSEAFSEEREWRAVYSNDGDEDEGRAEVQFRARGSDIVPYLPLDIGASAQKTKWSLPISAIVVGSRVNRQRAEKSIRLLCRNRGIEVPELRNSQIPLQ